MLWFDGTVHEGTILPFDVADRGLLLGDGVFDTSLVLGGKMVWREAHLARLASASESLGFPLDGPCVDRAIAALTAVMPNGAMRITVTRGPGPRGLAPPAAPNPQILASIAPLRAGGFFAPLSLDVSTIRRNETSPAARLKTLNYLDGIFASHAATDAGFDDALFLNTKGHIACATAGNIIVLSGTQVTTPPLADGVLPGIVRQMVLRLARIIGLDPVEQSLSLENIQTADTVFVTNSLRLLAPVRRIGAVEKHAPGDLRVAALINAICIAIKEDCGLDPRDVLKLSS